MSAVVTITGFREFADKARAMPAELLAEFDDVAGLAAGQWEQGAKNALAQHTDLGGLVGDINNKRVVQGDWEVVSAAEYSPWVEWGTRLKVHVPPELSAYAAQFKGQGTGKDAKKFIFAWAQRQGIEPAAWYPIYLSIMRTGVNPHPFFFVQKPIVEAQFLKDLKQILNTER